MKRHIFITCLLAAICVSLCTDATAQRDRFGGQQATGPRKSPEELEFKDGVGQITDLEMFDKLSYQGPDVMRDAYLAGTKFVKFQLEDANSDKPVMYFLNTKTHRGHPFFMRAIGIGGGPRGRVGQMRGAISWRPLVNDPNGEPGVYIYDFQPNDAYTFEEIKICHEHLIKNAPILKGRLAYHPLGQRGVDQIQRDKAKYDAAKLPFYLDEQLFSDIGFLPLNHAESFGRLRLMQPGQIPSQRDIVVYKSLPNEMPRVAGIITDVMQTPLSHVNLRAVQDKVPNAFIKNASATKNISSLIGDNVYYKVDANGFEIRVATQVELDSHFAALRPAQSQTPQRDLSKTEIAPLDKIKFTDSLAYGVKTSNLAAMLKFNLPEKTVPDGFGIPFSFYDEFMKVNGLYEIAIQMMSDESFKTDRRIRETELKKFQKLITDGNMPTALADKIAAIQKSFQAGIRCRSSTNNEDLPGFSGAGLYDSFTHRPDEGHLANTIKQVFASLWNLRAFEEREFYRIDHNSTAMGVLLHPNYDEELVNGVAVTQDILYQTTGNSYVNVQVGEDLVTNPEQQSVPEEILLGWSTRVGHRVMRKSNRIANDKTVLDEKHIQTLRERLNTIHSAFAKLYGKPDSDPQFAMELEFKITNDGLLIIKQARPWVR